MIAICPTCKKEIGAKLVVNHSFNDEDKFNLYAPQFCKHCGTLLSLWGFSVEGIAYEMVDFLNESYQDISISYLSDISPINSGGDTLTTAKTVSLNDVIKFYFKENDIECPK